MSCMILEYLESRLSSCTAMIAEAADAASRLIFEETRARLLQEIATVQQEDACCRVIH